MHSTHTVLFVSNSSPLCSIFVALQEVNWTNGPTIVLPETHTLEFHSSINVTEQEATHSADGVLEYVEDIRKELEEDGSIQHTLAPRTFTEEEIRDAGLCGSTGFIYAMDSRALHCGGANKSDKPRAVLCFAFQDWHRSGREDRKRRGHPERITGFTYHLNDELVRKPRTLADFLK